MCSSAVDRFFDGYETYLTVSIHRPILPAAHCVGVDMGMLLATLSFRWKGCFSDCGFALSLDVSVLAPMFYSAT